MTALSPDQVLQLAAEFSAQGDAARAILTDPTIVLSGDQSNVVTTDMDRFYDTAQRLGIMAAQITFADTDVNNAFNTIKKASQDAQIAIQALKSDASKLNALIGLLGALVSLAVSLGTGNAVSVITAAANVSNAASNAIA